MDCVFGIAFKDFAIVASDMTQIQSIIVLKDEEQKVFKLSDNILMAITGETGDTTQFAEYIAKSIQLYKMRNGYDLSPSSAAHFTRRDLADYLRSRTPYFVNLLLAGYDKRTETAELYFMDYLASMAKVPYAGHGYGAYFAFGVMDRYYRADMTRDEAYDLLKKCVTEIQKRLVVNLPKYQVHIVDKDGITQKDPITAKTLALEQLQKA